MRRRRRGSVVTTVVTATALGVLVSGCGVAGTDYQPGAAATVEDATLSTDTVDRYATYFCDALDAQAFGEVGQVARLELKQGVAGNLARRLAAEEFAAQYDLEPGDYYQQVVNQAREGLGDLPEAALDALVEVQSSEAYVNEVALAAGERSLTEDGEDPTQEAAQERGNQLFAQWLADQDVEFDPSLGVELADDGTWVRTDTSTSVAGSSQALVAAGDPVDEAGQPDPAYTSYVASLPSSQRCG